VFCLLALRHQFLPPNINWHNPMEDGIIPITQYPSRNTQHPSPITHILSNAFGFGGNDSSIILSKGKSDE
jgi:3-oxoacyl-(acyl-carrier-protein) synthase